MRQHLIARLVHAPTDLDYVSSFQELQSLNLQMRKSGPTVDRLLRKAILEMEVGNFSAGLAAAKDATVLAPELAEAHYQVGRAYVFLALAKAGSMPLGTSAVDNTDAAATTLVAKARDAFAQVVRLNPHDDEAQRDVDALEKLLESAPDEARLLVQLGTQ